MYAVGRDAEIKARTGWKEAMLLPGSRQMKYFKALFECFPWQEASNDQSLILNDNLENDEFRMALIGKQNDFILAYTPWGSDLVIDLSKMDADKVVAYWYNPRSGENTKIGQYVTSGKQLFRPWSNGRGSDFVLVLLKDFSNYKLPNFS